MKVEPIRRPRPGEHVLTVSPDLTPTPAADWRRRLNLTVGRSLSDRALETEQEGRAGRLALHGRTRAAGVVAGLEVGLERSVAPPGGGGPPSPDRDRFFHVAAGRGLTIQGEDAVLPRALRLSLRDLQVWVPLAADLEDPAPSESAPGLLTDAAWPRRRRGKAFGALLADNDWPEMPPAAVLVLSPVVVDRAGQVDPDDPCDLNPSFDAFADWHQTDGVQFALYPWPAEWLFLPDPAAADRQWRNRLAYAVYDAERKLGPTRWLPWEEAGVPLGLVGFDAARQPLFVDRFAVVRTGGGPRPRTAVVPNAGNPGFWEARVRQFADHLAEAVENGRPEPAKEFRYLPPVGALPRDALDLRGGADRFFPPAYRVSVAPAPLEQLDLAVAAGSSLRAYDTTIPDQVQVLVPVPQTVFEPKLLLRETVAPVFDRTIAALVGHRGNVLARRENLRAKVRVLTHALTGIEPPVPAPADDPERLEPEALPALPFAGPAHVSSLLAGQHRHRFLAAAPLFTGGGRLSTYVYLDPDAPPAQVMVEWHGTVGEWEHRASWGADALPLGTAGTASRRQVGPLPETGRWVRLEVPAAEVGLDNVVVDGVAFTLFGGRAAWGPFGVTGVSEAAEFAEPPEGATTDGEEPWQLVRGDDVLAPLEDGFGTELRTPEPGDGEDDAPRRVALALESLRTDIAPGTSKLTAEEFAELAARGLARFVAFLEEKVRRVDDAVDFGFLRVQTDIYRVRQHMLGATAATRLATSPVLAGIARGETAAATGEQLADFFARTRVGGTGGAGPLGEAAPAPDEAVPLAGEATARAATLTGERSAARVSGSALTRAETGAAVFRPPIAAAGPRFVLDPRTAEITEVLAPGGAVGPTLGGGRGEILGPIGGGVIGGAVGGAVVGGPVGGIAEEAPAIELPGGIGPALAAETRGVAFIGGRAARFARSPETIDIIGQPPVLGEQGVPRTVTVAARIEQPAAPESKNYSVASKHDVVKSLAGLDVNLADLKVPGVAVTPTEGPRVRRAVDLADFAADGRLADILDDPDPDDGDEAEFFAQGVQLLEHTTATLRAVEGRAAEYRLTIARCRQAQAEIEDGLGRGLARLRVVGDVLAEARHDVSVARALRAEEQARVDAINGRRDRVLAESVEFLLFHRPRVADRLVMVPARVLDPGLAPAPVPACLARDPASPPELRAMVDTLRAAPLRWFVGLPPLLDRFERPEFLLETVRHAQVRAQVGALVPAARPFALGGPFGPAIGRVLETRETVTAQVRTRTVGVDLGRLAVGGWRTVRAEATDVVSIGDLIDAPAGRSDVARAASRRLDQIARVAGCLWEGFGEAPPAVRLEWAQRLSQHDAPVALRNLASLPRWGELDRETRRELQTLADWLYAQADAAQPDAVRLVDDLVRVCLLVASHAPARRIVAGHVARPATVAPGDRLELTPFDPARVRIGMGARLLTGDRVVAHAVVEDLGRGAVSARIVRSLTVGGAIEEAAPRAGVAIQVTAATRVQFTDDVLAAPVSTAALRETALDPPDDPTPGPFGGTIGAAPFARGRVLR